MNRRFMIALIALALVPAAASARGVGLGVFGGASIPILQDNATQGTQFGARVPVNIVPLLTVEPFYAKSKLGDKTDTFAGLSYTRDGGEVTSFGANVMLNLGGPVSFYPFAGLTSSKLEVTGSEDVKKTGYDFGLGFGIAIVPKLRLDVRGELNAVVTDQTSRKYGNITGGVSYALFSMP
jgi:hypothetical protein